MGARSIQIFSQNPRAWKPTRYSEEQVAAYHEALRGQPGRRAADPRRLPAQPRAATTADFQEKTLASLTHRAAGRRRARRDGSRPPPRLGEDGRRRRGDRPRRRADHRGAEESGSCPLHLENTAGAGGTLGRSFEELARLLEVCGGGGRLGVCLDSCHLLASGFDVAPRSRWARCSTTSTGSSASTGSVASPQRQPDAARLEPRPSRQRRRGRDRRARAAPRSSPSRASRAWPACWRRPGPDKKGPWAGELRLCEELRAEGLKARRRAKSRAAAVKKR